MIRLSSSISYNTHAKLTTNSIRPSSRHDNRQDLEILLTQPHSAKQTWNDTVGVSTDFFDFDNLLDRNVTVDHLFHLPRRG